MPHGGYHGVVKMGGKIIQQGSTSDGQGGQTGGGVYNPDGYETEIAGSPAPDTTQNISQQIADKKKEIELLNANQEGINAIKPDMLVQDIQNFPMSGATGIDAINLAKQQNFANQQLNNLLIQQAQAEARDRILAGATIPSVDVEQGFGNTGVLNKADLTGYDGGLFGLNIGATPSMGMSGVEELKNPYTEEILFSTDPNNLGSRQDELLKAREGLTTSQYNKFIADLYDANPELYQETFPFASGQIAKPILARIGEGIMGLPGASQIGQLASSLISPLSGLFTGQSTTTPKIRYDDMGNAIGIISQAPDGGSDAQEVDKFGNPVLPMGQYSAIPEEYKGFFESEFAKPVAGGMAITYVTLPDGRRIRFGDTGSAAQFRKYLESIGVTPQEEPTEKVEVETPKEEKAPFDLAQFYAGLPTFNQSPYARQGLGSYNEMLRKYFG